MFRYRLVTVLALSLILALPGCARSASDDKPPPDVRDAKYGPYERNVLDLWKATLTSPRRS